MTSYPRFSLLDFLKTSITIIFLIYSFYLLITEFYIYHIFVIESIVYGILMWVFTGLLAPYVIYYLFLWPSKILKMNLFLLKRHKDEENLTHTLNLILKAINTSAGPTFLAFGILNLILNYFDFVLNLGFMIFVYLVVIGLGIIIPLVWIIGDSDLVIIDKKQQIVQPVGVLLKSYLRGISSFAGILGLSYTLFSLTGDISIAVLLILAVLALTFPPIFIINIIYTAVHPYFVAKLNRMLLKVFGNCKIKVELNTPEEAQFVVESVG